MPLIIVFLEGDIIPVQESAVAGSHALPVQSPFRNSRIHAEEALQTVWEVFKENLNLLTVSITPHGPLLAILPMDTFRQAPIAAAGIRKVAINSKRIGVRDGVLDDAASADYAFSAGKGGKVAVLRAWG